MQDTGVLGIAKLVLVAFAVIVVSRAMRTVPQGWPSTIERFGRYARTLQPGLRFMIPVTGRVGAKIDMMAGPLDMPVQEVISRDNTMAHAIGPALVDAPST